jgi:hypothetical protein
MPDVGMDIVIEQILDVLREGAEGPPERWSYFTDNSPDAGLFGTLARCDAALASRPIGGTTIAAHVHHTAFAMDASAAWIRGDRAKLDWPSSWSVTTVDAASWAALTARLRSSYVALRSAIESKGRENVESIGGAIGAAAHAAYHLGAIRQKMAVARG